MPGRGVRNPGIGGCVIGVAGALEIGWVAGVLGIILGAIMVIPVFLSVRLLDSRRPELAVPAAMGAMIGGLIVGLGVLFAVQWAAPSGFVTFAVSTVAGFMLAVVAGGVWMFRRMYRSEETGS